MLLFQCQGIISFSTGVLVHDQYFNEFKPPITVTKTIRKSDTLGTKLGNIKLLYRAIICNARPFKNFIRYCEIPVLKIEATEIQMI